jgi:hypothetical protein
VAVCAFDRPLKYIAPETQVVTKIMVMAKLQERVEWKKTSFTDPERLAFRLSENQVDGRSGEPGDSKLLGKHQARTDEI